jgi:hypothetical protein
LYANKPNPKLACPCLGSKPMHGGYPLHSAYITYGAQIKHDKILPYTWLAEHDAVTKPLNNVLLLKTCMEFMHQAHKQKSYLTMVACSTSTHRTASGKELHFLIPSERTGKRKLRLHQGRLGKGEVLRGLPWEHHMVPSCMRTCMCMQSARQICMSKGKNRKVRRMLKILFFQSFKTETG